MCVALEKMVLKKPQTMWVDVSLLLVNIIHVCTFVYIIIHVHVIMRVHNHKLKRILLEVGNSEAHIG